MQWGWLWGFCRSTVCTGCWWRLWCLPFRLDTVLAFTATMISNPFTFPLLTWLEVHIGCKIWAVSAQHVEALLRGEGVMDLGYQLMVGASVTALLVGSCGAVIVWTVANRVQANKLR